jgi:transcriptional regulator with XRE-family HTH domain
MRAIGEIIKYYRKTRTNMSQRELGVRALGLSDRAAQAKISRLESGLQFPTVMDLENIEKVLNLDPGTLERDLKESYFSSKNNEKEVKILRSNKETEKYLPNLDEILPDLAEEHPAFIDYLNMLNTAARVKNHDLMISIVKSILNEFEKKNAGELSDKEAENCATV